MQKPELKKKLQELFQANEETFIDALNEIWLEAWEKEEEKDDLPMVGIFGSDWVEVLKKKITKEIGEKYVQNSSKLATLLAVSANVEIIEKATSRQKAQAIENDPKSLDGLKEIVKHFDKENSW